MQERYDRFNEESRHIRSIFEATDKASNIKESTRIKEDSTLYDLTSDITPILKERKMNESEVSTSRLFRDLQIPREIVKGVERMKIQSLNSTQKKILPILMRTDLKSDIYIQTKPFSYESVAFLINAFTRIDTSVDEPQVVILSPTTELVMHTSQIAKQMAKYSDIKISHLTGDNKSLFTVNDHIICATLGTLLFCLNRRDIFDIRKVKVMILVEFQILISSHKFSEFVRELIKKLKKKTQLQIFSSCYDCSTDLEFIKRYAINLKSFRLSSKDDFFRNMVHFKIPCKNNREKYDALVDVLKKNEQKKVLIFVVGKDEADQLVRRLDRDGLKIDILTSDLTMDERLNSIDNFRFNEQSTLILNYPLNIGTCDQPALIINFELPVYSGVFDKFFNEYYYRCSSCMMEADSSSTRPNFVVNIFENSKIRCLPSLENHFGIRMIELDRYSLKEQTFV